jgi:capsular polysaccharide transport system permease protein
MTEDQLYRDYQKAVTATFNMVEQVNVIQVSAFSPNSSEKIGNGLLGLAQDFVARMDEQGVADSLQVAAQQVRSAEIQDVSAANALAQWRAGNRNIDPEAESTMVMQMIGQIEQELNTARINYQKILALGNPDHPLLKPAQDQVAALEQQLGEARGRLAGTGNSEAAHLKSYEQLKNAQTFADNNLAAARNAYQQAFLQTMRLRRYVTVIARPVAEDRPSSPNLALLALEGLLVGLVLAFATSVGLGLIKPRRA